MEIRIGITQSGRELSFETNESAKAVSELVTDALATQAAHVSFSDAKGSTFIVPTASIAYVELGSEETRRVGFVA